MISITSFLYFAAAASAILGFFVLVRSPQRTLNRAYFYLTLAISGWIIGNVLFREVEAFRFIFALSSYAAAGLVATLFYFFCATLSHRIEKHQQALVVIGIVAASIAAVPGVLATGVDGITIATTPFIVVYALYLLFFFAFGLWELLWSIKSAKELLRTQRLTVLAGVIFAITGGVICNLILPITGNYSLTSVGPAFSFVFLVTSAYAVIRQKLFDVRFAVTRVLAYTVSVFLVGIIVGGLVNAVFGLLGFNAVFSREFSVLIASLLIAAIFSPVKSSFDSITRRIFYQFTYDRQKVIDRLTDELAHSVNTSVIAKHTLDIIKATVGNQWGAIVLVDEQNSISKVYPASQKKYVHQEVVDALKNNSQQLISIDSGDEETAIIRQMAAHNVSVTARLRSPNKLIGYMMIGYKHKGTSYTTQDIELFDIASDELSIAIENAERFQEIQQFNDELQRKITDATDELRTSNSKLRSLDESKDEFISMASHQLRTPLTSIKGYLSMVIEGDMGKITPDQKRVLDEAYFSSQRMVYLINDFLNVSRLQTGKFELEKTNVQLSQLIFQEIDQLRASASSRNITIRYDPPDNFPVFKLDENKIRQVMMNFIDNAIYYAKPSGGTIDIVLTKHGSHISFKVIDTGIGVPRTEWHRLFTKFYRASNAKKARPDGTGIGLFMAKKVIVAHGGAIVFESIEGKGSTFGFRLPIETT